MKIVVFEIHPRSDVDQEAYGAAFEEMVELVAEVHGFVSIQAFTGEGGTELALARFEDDEAIRRWREQPRHVETRDRGRNEFFESYDITIATVSRHYQWVRGESPPLLDEPSLLAD